MLIIFTGDGKGKTTAALGQAARAVGRGKRVLMVQFIKGPWKSGEDFVDFAPRVAALGERPIGSFELRKMGRGFVGILGDTLPREEHIRAAKEALAFVAGELPKYDLIILDEVNVAVSLGLLTPGEVLDALASVSLERHIILTGRGAPKEFLEAAHLVTEMREVKHPYNDGTLAELALEF